MSTSILTSLLEKTDHYDKDERYMATSDICAELSKDIKIDEVMERRICAAILKQLDDPSNNVQTVAVRCLAILVKKVHETQIGEICDKLCALILEGKSSLRDIYSMGLKTLMADVPDDMGNLVASLLTTRLLRGISTSQNDDIKREYLDRLDDLLQRFGQIFTREHDDIMISLMRLLESAKSPVRRRAAACLGSLAVVSSENLLNRLVESLLSQINMQPSKDKNTLIQTVGNISRHVGYRLGKYLDRLVPVFITFCGDPDDESQQNEAANELRESCFPGLESFVLRCPREVAPQLKPILQVAFKFINYDPNYSYDEGDAMDTDDVDADEEDYGDDDDNGGSEDDDGSWKVRKAAVKVLSATLTARPGSLPEVYTPLMDTLLSRFKEREESVRLDILNCFTSLLNVTAIVTGAGTTLHSSVVTPAPGMGVGVPALSGRVPDILTALRPHLLGTAPPKTKAASFALLRALVIALKGGVEDHLPVLFTVIQKSLQDKTQSQTLRLDALQLLRLLFELHEPAALQPAIPSVLPLVLAASRDDWVKMTVESLRAIAVIISAMRPLNGDSSGFVQSSFDPSPFIAGIYEAVFQRLQALDIDQEIKEGAVMTVGKLVQHLGDKLTAELPAVFTILLRRLETGVTRMAALKTFATIGTSPLHIDMTEVLPQIIVNLAGLLKQQSRSLKQTSLQTLDALIGGSAGQLPMQLVSNLLHEAAPLVSDNDLHLGTLTLKLALTITDKVPNSATTVYQEIMPRAILLSASPLLQGLALTNLISLLQTLVASDIPGLTFTSLFESFIDRTDANIPKQSVVNLSKCLAGLCLHLPQSIRDDVVQRLAGFVQSSEGNNARLHLSLLCMGELGQQIDLAYATNLKDLIQACFEREQEEIKTAAAFALGHLAMGNVPVFLPVIVDGLVRQHQPYLYLQALREILMVHANSHKDFSTGYDLVVPVLLTYCHAEEEGVRSMIAECLGALACMDPRVLQVYESLLVDTADKSTRWTVAAALRFTLSQSQHSTAFSGSSQLRAFLVKLLDDVDIEVRRAAVMAVNAGLHYNPHVVRDLMGSEIVPRLTVMLRFKSERVVDLGPFKHKVDDGLPLRKSVLACVETTLDVLPAVLLAGGGVAELLQLMSVLLDDKPEIRLQAYQVLGKLCLVAGDAVLGFLDQLVDPLEKALKRKASSADAPAENAAASDRTQELVRTALRTILIISELEGSGSSRRWQELLERVRKDERNASVLDAIRFEKTADHS